MILCCPTCVGPDYYAVLKTSGNRILRCPVADHGTVAFSSSLETLVCRKPVSGGTCGKKLEVTDRCPNCNAQLVQSKPVRSQGVRS